MSKIVTLSNSLNQMVPIFDLSGPTQNRTYNATGGASQQSAAMGASTVAVIVTTEESSVRIAIGENPTASANTLRIPKGAILGFMIQPGQKIAVVSNDATTGTLVITELTSDAFPLV